MNKKEKLMQDDLSYVWHPFTQMKEQRKWGSKIIIEGKGCKLRDIDGKEYIDAMGGMETTAIGHGRQEPIHAIVEQGKKLEFEHTFDFFTNELTIKLAKKLAEITPGDLQYVHFGCSGSDVVEIALKIARQYQARKGFSNRYKIIARRDSFHGVSMGALSANGITQFRESFGPLVPGFRHIPAADCYHCAFNKRYPDCDIDCAEALEKQILFEGPETIAAFIGEPIPCVRGIVPPPREYLPKIREICNRYQILYIADEILVGFGKSGKLFACEHYGVVPDLMTVGKAITSGYFPLSAVIVKPRIYEAFLGPSDKEAFMHGQTYQGHPLGCAVALKNIEIIEKEDLVRKAEDTGRYFGERLKTLANHHHQIVANISGKGLLQSLLIHTKNGSEVTEDIEVKIRERAYELGLILRFMLSHIIIIPPLVFTNEEVDKTVEILDQLLTEAEKEYL